MTGAGMARGLVAIWLIASAAAAQVSEERLRGAAEEPANWLTYSGNYHSWRFFLTG